MSHGKYLSLKEARKGGKVNQFAKEHPSEGDASLFTETLEAMIRKKPRGAGTSHSGASEGYSGTRTRPGTSEDAGD